MTAESGSGKGIALRRIALAVVAATCLVELFFVVKVIRDQPSAASEAATPSGSTSGKPQAVPSAANLEPVGLLRLLLTAKDGLVVRSWRGSCSEAGRTRLQISPDGGRSFDEIALPILDKKSKAPGIRTLLAIEASSRDDITIVGSDKTCSTASYRTKDGGQTWKALDAIDGWYLNATSTEVGTNGEVSVPGCSILRVAAVNDLNAKVLCSNGDILGTNDAGGEWAGLGDLDGAVDVSFLTLRDGLGLRATADCAAELASTSDAGGSWDAVSCIVKKSPGKAESMVARGTLVVAQVAGVVYRSTDSGETWDKADQG